MIGQETVSRATPPSSLDHRPFHRRPGLFPGGCRGACLPDRCCGGIRVFRRRSERADGRLRGHACAIRRRSERLRSALPGRPAGAEQRRDVGSGRPAATTSCADPTKRGRAWRGVRQRRSACRQTAGARSLQPFADLIFARSRVRHATSRAVLRHLRVEIQWLPCLPDVPPRSRWHS